MAEEKTYTKADIDAAVAAATAKIQESVDRLESKNEELVGELRSTKSELRKTKDISPEDFAALESDNEKLRADLAKAQKEAKDAGTRAEKAEKSLETEQSAARNYAIEAAIADQVTSIGVVPALSEGFKAMHRGNFTAELVDGAYVVKTADGKDAKTYFSEIAGSDAGKHWISSGGNSGGGAPGGGRGGGGGKQLSEADVNAMSPKERAAFFNDGGSIADAA